MKIIYKAPNFETAPMIAFGFESFQFAEENDPSIPRNLLGLIGLLGDEAVPRQKSEYPSAI